MPESWIDFKDGQVVIAAQSSLDPQEEKKKKRGEMGMYQVLVTVWVF